MHKKYFGEMKPDWANIKIVVFVVVAMLAAGAFFTFTERRTEQVMEAGTLYAACVEDSYGMSPSQWYNEYGSYPVCDPNNPTQLNVHGEYATVNGRIYERRDDGLWYDVHMDENVDWNSTIN